MIPDFDTQRYCTAHGEMHDRDSGCPVCVGFFPADVPMPPWSEADEIADERAYERWKAAVE